MYLLTSIYVPSSLVFILIDEQIMYFWDTFENISFIIFAPTKISVCMCINTHQNLRYRCFRLKLSAFFHYFSPPEHIAKQQLVQKATKPSLHINEIFEQFNRIWDSSINFICTLKQTSIWLPKCKIATKISLELV